MSLDLNGIVESIVEAGLRGESVSEQVEAFCRLVTARGFPARRFNMSISTLHPQHGARSFIWRPSGMTTDEFPRTPAGEESEAYLRSPIHRMRASGTSMLRRRIDAVSADEFPLLADLARGGMTDYVAWVVGDAAERAEQRPVNAAVRRDPLREGAFFSCATDAPAGFEDVQIDEVGRLLPHFALATKSRATYDIASQLLQAYLGADAGERVLAGELDRHSVQRIHAVIWLCDLRSSSAVANRVSPEEWVAVLNDYLEMMARPVLDNGGQILSFLGDGFLATFDLSRRDPQAVCVAAVRAAEQLAQRADGFNAQRRDAGKHTLNFGVALHLGEVLYGNIGTSERLDFTVIGSAVNEANRIESMCRVLRRTVLMSARFHEAAGACQPNMISVGVHALRGIREPQELYTLPDAAI